MAKAIVEVMLEKMFAPVPMSWDGRMTRVKEWRTSTMITGVPVVFVVEDDRPLCDVCINHFEPKEMCPQFSIGVCVLCCDCDDHHEWLTEGECFFDDGDSIRALGPQAFNALHPQPLRLDKDADFDMDTERRPAIWSDRFWTIVSRGDGRHLAYCATVFGSHVVGYTITEYPAPNGPETVAFYSKEL